MNAIDTAKDMDALDLDDVGAMLRAQHEAIKTLREALELIEGSSMSMYATYSDAWGDQKDIAQAALAATEKLHA
jgi:hypothetical protein